MKVTIPDMIRCVEREIEMRKRTYPKWIDQGRMKRDAAVMELTHMRAVRATLIGLSGYCNGVEISIPEKDKDTVQ